MRIRTLENRSFLLLVVLTTLAFVWVLRPLLGPVLWAAVLAVLFQGTFRRLTRRLGGRRSLAAAVTLVLAVVVVILPVALIAVAVVQEATALVGRIASGELDLSAGLAAADRLVPAAADWLGGWGVEVERVQASLQSAALAASQQLAAQALTVGENALTFLLLFGVMLYVLYFFIRDGEHIVEALVLALPLGDRRERRLFAKFADVARATIKGTLVVAVVQGALTTVLFWIVGVEGAVLWGVVTAALSLIPAVGSALVWGPAGIVLIVSGALGKGILVLVVGVLVIGLADNVLRPILVGRDIQMPDYLVLLATLGGIGAFGVSGIVIGPLVAAFFLVVWQMFAEDFGGLDDARAALAAEAAAAPETDISEVPAATEAQRDVGG